MASGLSNSDAKAKAMALSRDINPRDLKMTDADIIKTQVEDWLSVYENTGMRSVLLIGEGHQENQDPQRNMSIGKQIMTCQHLINRVPAGNLAMYLESPFGKNAFELFHYISPEQRFISSFTYDFAKAKHLPTFFSKVTSGSRRSNACLSKQDDKAYALDLALLTLDYPVVVGILGLGHMLQVREFLIERGINVFQVNCASSQSTYKAAVAVQECSIVEIIPTFNTFFPFYRDDKAMALGNNVVRKTPVLPKDTRFMELQLLLQKEAEHVMAKQIEYTRDDYIYSYDLLHALIEKYDLNIMDPNTTTARLGALDSQPFLDMILARWAKERRKISPVMVSMFVEAGLLPKNVEEGVLSSEDEKQIETRIRNMFTEAGIVPTDQRWSKGSRSVRAKRKYYPKSKRSCRKRHMTWKSKACHVSE
jgi:hypothetical protein